MASKGDYYYQSGLSPNPDCPTCKRTRCKQCQKREHFDRKWNQQKQEHLTLIVRFLELYGMPIKAKQLQEVDTK